MNIDAPAFDVYGIFVSMFFLILTIVVLFTSGSIIAVLVLWALIALILTVLSYYGYLDINALMGRLTKKPKPAAAPAAAVPATPSKGGPMVGSEVFHIADAAFTYEEAKAVCAAYNGEVATLEQIIEAYNSGAEWCSYGWSAGGMALYPTQKGTWDELQRELDPAKRTRCGRPGVNGGYFDPMTKFGVNCFGFKPKGEFTPPAPIPGQDTAGFQEMVNRFKAQLKTFSMDPYSRGEWSVYGNTMNSVRNTVENFWVSAKPPQPKYAPNFEQTFYSPRVIEHAVGDVRYDESGIDPIPYGQGPYGLMGSLGPTGSQGLRGVLGDTGPTGVGGRDGTNGTNGTNGRDGSNGTNGENGGKGDPGKDATGYTGPTGLKGDPGTAAAAGTPGTNGENGEKGEKGDTGPTGLKGNDGLNGEQGIGFSPSRVEDLNRVFEQSGSRQEVWDGRGRSGVGWKRLVCPAGTLPIGVQGNLEGLDKGAGHAITGIGVICG